MLKAITDTYDETSGGDAVRTNLMALAELGAQAEPMLGPGGSYKVVSSGNTEVCLSTRDFLSALRPDSPAGKMAHSAVDGIWSSFRDGTTTYAVLLGRMASRILELLDSGVHPNTIYSALPGVKSDIRRILSEMSIITDYHIHASIIDGRAHKAYRHLDREAFVSTCWETFTWLKDTARSEGVRFLEAMPRHLEVVSSRRSMGVLDGIILGKGYEIKQGLYVAVRFPAGGKVMGLEAEMILEDLSSRASMYDVMAGKLASHGVDGAFVSLSEGNWAIIKEALDARDVNAVLLEEEDFQKVGRHMPGIWTGAGDPAGVEVISERGEGETILYMPGVRTVELPHAGPFLDDAMSDTFYKALYGLLWSETGKGFRVLPGGGTVFHRLYAELPRGPATGKEMLVREALADAMLDVLRVMVSNTGRDADTAIATLNSLYSRGRNGYHYSGEVVEECWVYDPYAVIDYVLSAALETLGTLVRIDDVIMSRYRSRKPGDWGLDEDDQDLDDYDYIEKYARGGGF